MAALACALTAFSCGKQDEPPENVVLVVVDTLHAGRTSLYGYERETTPRISEWAQGGGTPCCGWHTACAGAVNCRSRLVKAGA